MAQFNIGCYLEKAFYSRLVLGQDKFFTFKDGPALKYRIGTINGEKVGFKVAVRDNFRLVTPSKNLTRPSTTPLLVLLAADPHTVTPFSLLCNEMAEQLGEAVEFSYNGEAYLNTEERVYRQLEKLTADGAQPELIFTITLRWVLLREGCARAKFILSAVDDVASQCAAKCKAAEPKPNLLAVDDAVSTCAAKGKAVEPKPNLLAADDVECSTKRKDVETKPKKTNLKRNKQINADETLAAVRSITKKPKKANCAPVENKEHVVDLDISEILEGLDPSSLVDVANFRASEGIAASQACE